MNISLYVPIIPDFNFHYSLIRFLLLSYFYYVLFILSLYLLHFYYYILFLLIRFLLLFLLSYALLSSEIRIENREKAPRVLPKWRKVHPIWNDNFVGWETRDERKNSFVRMTGKIRHEMTSVQRDESFGVNASWKGFMPLACWHWKAWWY